MRRIGIWVFVWFCLTAGFAFAQNNDLAKQAPKRLANLNDAVAKLQQRVADLESNFAREIDERDRLMLQRRFVEGREFFYMLRDYRGAAEVFYPLVHHSQAASLPNYQEATFYLADSLFNIAAYDEARTHYQMIVKDPQSEYFGISLMRLIEIAVVQRKYDEADRLYARFLAEFPQEEDGSLGRYIIGKSFFLRGETAKALEVFDSISESGSYYPTAQYFAAVIFVKQKNFPEAINRLQRVKRTLTPDSANHAKIFALTHLALGRIYYETNDFPQSMARYYTVPPDSPEYTDALYESMWVFITRNDFLVRALDEERNNYEDLLFGFSDFRDSITDQPDQESLADMLTQTDQLQGELDAVRGLFDEIDKNLSRLQEEALTSFNKLVAGAPNHAIMPEAELLVGNIYTQVEDFANAEAWFNKVREKYDRFYQNMHAAQANLGPSDRLDVLTVGTDWAASGGQLDPGRARGLSPEIVYWLTQEPQLKRLFAMYRGVLQERENITLMRRMLDEADAKLAELNSGAGGYPFLREAHRKMLAARSDIAGLQVESTALRNDAEQVGDEALRNQIQSACNGHDQLLSSLQGRLGELEGRIEAKKRERLAYFRQEIDVLRSPIASLAVSVDSLYARAADSTAQRASQEMDAIERRLRDYVDRADLGIIDVQWRATRGSSREIREIQRDMQEEIRRFQRMQREGGQQPSQPPAAPRTPPAGQQPPAPPSGEGQPAPPAPQDRDD